MSEPFSKVLYTRAFLLDLKHLEPAAYWRLHQFVFLEFVKMHQLSDLPEIHAVDAGGIYFRFTVDDYLVAIELTGHIIKFLRVLPKPEIPA